MEQLCTFELGRLFVGIEIRHVQEILHWQPITQVPLAPPTVRGLMSLRGQIVPVLDLRERLGVDPTGNLEPYHVLVRTNDGPVSLLVDRVADVIEVDDQSFEPAPETLQRDLRALIRGAYKLERRLLLALDAEAAVNVEI
jgi:purine-binding chemotaxis protein CheW